MKAQMRAPSRVRQSVFVSPEDHKMEPFHLGLSPTTPPAHSMHKTSADVQSGGESDMDEGRCAARWKGSPSQVTWVSASAWWVWGVHSKPRGKGGF